MEKKNPLVIVKISVQNAMKNDKANNLHRYQQKTKY